VRAPLSSLLDQLEAAKGANSGRGGAFAARSKPPLWIDAVSLLDEIDLEVRPYRRDTRVLRVRAWSAAMHTITETDVLESVARQAEDWVRRARALLDPNPPAELDGDCPRCGRSWLENVRDAGAGEELVLTRALRATETPTVAWCEHCAARWEGEALWVLADHLNRQTTAEHLAEEPPSC